MKFWWWIQSEWGKSQLYMYQPWYALAKKVIPVVWVLVNFWSVPNVLCLYDNVRHKHGQCHQSDIMLCDWNCFCWSLALIMSIPNVSFQFHIMNIFIDNHYLQALHYMYHYMAAAGHNNYTTSLALFIPRMLEVEHTHPAVYEAFMRGLFPVRRTDGDLHRSIHRTSSDGWD